MAAAHAHASVQVAARLARPLERFTMTGHEDAMALVTASLHANQAGLSRLDHELRRDPDRTQAAIAALLSMTLGLLRAYSEEHGVDPGETLAVWGQQMALGAEDTG